jgi:cytoskeletal protein CcmA (bactofilin family)
MAEKRSTDGELSLVGSNTVIEGKITTEGSIRIDGKLVGDLVAKANAAIGLSGVVEGTVQAANISLAGKVTGTLTANEKLVLESKASVKGDIRASRLVVDEGAVFDGHCAMTAPPKPGGHRDH